MNGDFTFPEGKALRLDTEIGLAGPEEVAALLREATTFPQVNDLDRDVLLRLASSIESMDGLLSQAIDTLNRVALAVGENTRLSASDLFMSLSVTTPSMVTFDEDV